MTTTTVDLLEQVKRDLQSSGASSAVAEATAKAIFNVVEQRDTETLATKADIADVKVFMMKANIATIGVLGGLIALFQFFG